MIKYNTYEFKTTKEEVERRKNRELRFTNIFCKDDERNKGIELNNLSYHQMKILIYSNV